MPGCGWNIFDCIVVAIQLIEEILLAIRVGQSALNGLRALRVVRVLRVLRVLRLLEDLRTLVSCIAASLKPFFWAVLLLFLMVYVISVYFTQLVLNFRLDHTDDAPETRALTKWFGTLGRSILSMYQALSGGLSWNDIASPLIEHISWVLGILITLYIAFSCLAMMNVITGAFVDSALRQANEDRSVYLVKQARSLFRTLDLDRKGGITLEHFKAKWDSEALLQYFQEIDVDVSEAGCLFEILDINNNGSIDCDEFLSGLLRLKGPAKALDLVLVARELRRAFEQQMEHLRGIEMQLLWVRNAMGSFGAGFRADEAETPTARAAPLTCESADLDLIA